MTVVAALLGAGMALGVYFLFSGFRPSDETAGAPPQRPDVSLVQRRLALAAGFGAPVALLTPRAGPLTKRQVTNGAPGRRLLARL